MYFLAKYYFEALRKIFVSVQFLEVRRCLIPLCGRKIQIIRDVKLVFLSSPCLRIHLGGVSGNSASSYGGGYRILPLSLRVSSFLSI